MLNIDGQGALKKSTFLSFASAIVPELTCNTNIKLNSRP